METKQIEISTKFTQKQFIQFIYYLTYQKLVMKGTTILGIFLLLMTLLQISLSDSTFQFSYFIMPFVFLGLIPLSVYFQARTNFRQDKRMSEQIIYKANEEGLQVIGESFKVSTSWQNVHKVVESKKWMIVYETPNSARLLPKNTFTEISLATFKTLLHSVDGLKIRLKK